MRDVGILTFVLNLPTEDLRIWGYHELQTPHVCKCLHEKPIFEFLDLNEKCLQTKYRCSDLTLSVVLTDVCLKLYVV